MSKVLIVAEHLDGKLNNATAKCVSAAKALNAEAIDIVVLDADPARVAAQAAEPAHVAERHRHVPGDQIVEPGAPPAGAGDAGPGLDRRRAGLAGIPGGEPQQVRPVRRRQTVRQPDTGRQRGPARDG